jgi:hypothetical protein
MGNLTIEEVEKMCDDLGIGVLINDGHVVGFEVEEE